MGFAYNDLADADAIMEFAITLAANNMAGTDSDIFANVDYTRLLRDFGVGSVTYSGIIEIKKLV